MIKAVLKLLENKYLFWSTSSGNCGQCFLSFFLRHNETSIKQGRFFFQKKKKDNKEIFKSLKKVQNNNILNQ